MPNRDDPTIRRCIKFSMNWGFGGMKVYNLFAWRSSEPSDLLHVAEPVGSQNDEFLKSAGKFDLKIICAWGNVNWHLEQRSLDVLLMLRPFNPNYLQLTMKGFPSHPLYLKGNLTPKPWDIWPKAACSPAQPPAEGERQ